jgi:hypothetical protein
VTQFSFDVAAGNAALASFGLAVNERTRIAGQSLQGGCMAALLEAEWMAASAGVVPFYELPDGRKALIQIGAARERLDTAPESVRTLYLAAHGSARLSHLYATDANRSAGVGSVDLLYTHAGIGVLPLAIIVALTVTGVAAICAGAWYAKEATEKIVETRGDYLRSTYAVNQASVIASAALAAGQPIPDGVWRVFGEAAHVEKQAPSSGAPWLLGGIGIGAVALGAAFIYGGHHAAR